MFKKLVTNLPFNPSLISQVSFYSKRIKQERFVRRLGLIFVAATMTVQAVAFISPPERSLAASSAHIINGLRTRDDIINAWDQPGSDVPAIYGVFGLTRDDVLALPKTPNATVKSTDADYWSIGRTSLSGYSHIKEEFRSSQITVQYAGEDTETASDDRFIYDRQLKAWDVNNPSNSYRAFEGTISKTGEKFWLLVDCGNFTKIGKYTPPVTPEKPAPKPEVEIKKTIEDRPDHLKPGDSLTYKLSFRNPIKDTLAEDVVIEDQLDTKLFNVPNVSTSTYSITNGFLRYEYGSLAYTPTYFVVPLTVTLKDQISSGSSLCNQARITASNAPAKTSEKVCVGVINPCRFDSSVASADNPNCVEPKLVCSVVDFALNRSTRKASYRTTVSSSNPANTTILGYTYDFGDSSTQRFNTSVLTHQADHSYQPGEYDTTVTVHYRTTGQESADDKSISCAANVDFESDQPLGQHKKVANITQNTDGDLAADTTVNGGDVLEYTVTTTNPQNFDRANVDVSDYIGDILDYADLDTDFLAQQGGTFDAETNKINWTAQTIPASSSLDHVFRVSIKKPIPTTNLPSALGTTFDCKISNAYGNEITININCPLVKGLETLPNTGPGSSIIYSVIITTVVGYFYARSRLVAKELDIVVRDYAGLVGP